MKSFVAVAAIMAAVASAKPVADGWTPVYGTTESAIISSTTTPAAVYSTTASTTTPAAVYTTPATYSGVSSTTTSDDDCEDYTTTIKKTTQSASVYTTTKATGWNTWSASPTTYKPTVSASTSATWSTGASKPTPSSWNTWNSTVPGPKYTGAASQQGMAFGAMALAGVAMLL